tara:strand:+ start:126 stop:305 length:180 start_codon:yes stop_codon:yes gene_type:complete
MINIIENKCDYCGTCAAVCPVNCINVKEADIIIDHKTCIDCDLCVYICPIEVLETVNEA